MASSRKQFKIYGPTHFRSTWEKYLAICKRDGTNASKEIRIFVEGQVARRDPGNPQRTIEAFVPGHEDEALAKRSDLIKELIARAELLEGRLEYQYIVKRMKRLGLPGFRLVVLAKSMAEDLKKLGVKVYY